jgi:hypothetical protein
VGPQIGAPAAITCCMMSSQATLSSVASDLISVGAGGLSVSGYQPRMATVLTARVLGFRLCSPNPDEALDIDPIARLQICKLVSRLRGKIEKAIVDTNIQTGFVIRCKPVPYPCRGHMYHRAYSKLL